MNNVNHIDDLDNTVIVLKNEDFSILTYRRIGFALMCLSTLVTLMITVIIGNAIINWLS